MSGAPAGGGNSQADFEGHVEPRCAAGELNPTEVVERISARRDQLEDAVQPPCRTWDLERGSRAKPEGSEAGDQRDEQVLVAWLVGDVEEDVLRRVSLSDRSASACRAPPRCGPLPGALMVTCQGFGDHRPELAVALGRDAEHPGRRGRRRVRGGDHRARAQRHGPTLRSEEFSCQRARKDTAQLARRKRA